MMEFFIFGYISHNFDMLEWRNYTLPVVKCSLSLDLGSLISLIFSPLVETKSDHRKTFH
jgi:hypothetical protein